MSDEKSLIKDDFCQVEVGLYVCEGEKQTEYTDFFGHIIIQIIFQTFPNFAVEIKFD